MKTCTMCKIEKPFEAFYKNKAKKDGYKSECKECEKERYRELKKNPLMQLEKQIRSSIILENKLLAREGKKLCTKCKDIFLIDNLKDGAYGGRCKKCEREYSIERREKNKDKIKEYNKEYSKEYQEKNKNKIKEYQRKYRLKKKLEKENKIDPKAINAFMEELINIKE